MGIPLPRDRTLALDRPLIMGVLNVTPDSFSDGGRYVDPDAAVAQARRMIEEGADVIDVGGESTRPGAERVSADVQKQRIVPVIRRLVTDLDAVVSVDTTRADVAAAAIDAGAAILNDVTAGCEDPAMFTLAAERKVPMVLMHMQGEPATMQVDPRYTDVVAEVITFLRGRAAAARQAGFAKEQILLDPGIGFGKTLQHNLALLAALPRLVAEGYPVLLGTSRKRFLRMLCGKDGEEATAEGVSGGTCATTALGVAAGVTLFRVHEVLSNRHAADVAWAIRHGA